MIQFKYKKFAEDAQPNPVKKGPSKFGTAMDFGFAGLTGAGMISAHKQHGEFMEQSKQGLAATEQQTRAINKRLDQIEKEFAIPWAVLGTTANVGMMGGSMIQSSSQNKDQKEMNEQQVAAQDRQTQALQRQNALLKRIEQNGGDGEKARRVVETRDFSIMSERLYGINMSGITTAVKDLYRAGKKAEMGKGLKNNILWGVGTAGAAYGVNKIISHDMKKSGLDVDESGNLVQKQKSYTESVKQATKKTAEKKGGGFLGKMLGPTAVAAFEVPRAIGYFGEKKALMNQVGGTQLDEPAGSVMQQRSYAAKVGAIGKYWETAKEGLKTFWKHPGRSTTGGILNFGSFGVLNTEKVQQGAGYLSKNAKSNTMRKIGDWAQNHKTLANTAVLAPGIGLGMGAYGLGEKAVKVPMKAIDPDAYKYQESKDKAAKIEAQAAQQ